MGRGARAGRVRPDRAAAGRPELVLVLQRRRRPTSGTSSSTAAARCIDIGCYSVNLSRMLFGAEPTDVQAALRRDAATGVDVADERDPRVRAAAIATFTCSIRDRDRPARRTSTATEGRISVEHPVQHPARPADARLRDSPAASRRSRPATETLTFDDGRPVRRRGARRSPPRSSTASRRPSRRRTRVANLRVIERLFAAARSGRRYEPAPMPPVRRDSGGPRDAPRRIAIAAAGRRCVVGRWALLASRLRGAGSRSPTAALGAPRFVDDDRRGRDRPHVRRRLRLLRRRRASRRSTATATGSGALPGRRRRTRRRCYRNESPAGGPLRFARVDGAGA